MKTRNGLFADVPENLWNDWHWQVANRAETVEDLKKYMTLTPDEEAGVAKTLGKLRMAVTPYYLSLIDLNDPFDPIRVPMLTRFFMGFFVSHSAFGLPFATGFSEPSLAPAPIIDLNAASWSNFAFPAITLYLSFQKFLYKGFIVL